MTNTYICSFVSLEAKIVVMSNWQKTSGAILLHKMTARARVFGCFLEDTFINFLYTKRGFTKFFVAAKYFSYKC